MDEPLITANLTPFALVTTSAALIRATADQAARRTARLRLGAEQAMPASVAKVLALATEFWKSALGPSPSSAHTGEFSGAKTGLPT